MRWIEKERGYDGGGRANWYAKLGDKILKQISLELRKTKQLAIKS